MNGEIINLKNNFIAYCGLIVVSVMWGANFGVSRWAMEVFPAEVFVLLRFGLAVPLLFGVLYFTEKKIGIERKDILKIALIAFVGVAVLEIVVMYSIQYTTLANASLLNVAPWPIFAALFAPLFTKERMTLRLVFGGVAALAGVVLVILGGGAGLDFGSEHMLGNMMALSISLIGALYNLACMPLMNKYSPLRLTAWLSLFGVMFLIPFGVHSWDQISWSEHSTGTWIALLYNVVLCTLIAFVIWNTSMKKIGATRANFYRYLVPAVAVVTGALFFNEPILPLQIAGGLIIALSLLWISMESLKQKDITDNDNASQQSKIPA